MTVSQALRTWPFWALTAAITLATLPVQGVMFAVVPYFVEGGLPIAKAVSIYSFANLAAVPALFLGGALADRLGARRVLRYAILAQGVGTFSLIVTVGHFSLGPVAIVTFVVLWGISAGSPLVIGPIVLKDLVGGGNFGMLLGINSAISGIVSSLAPIQFGWIRELSGGYGTAFVIFGLLACAAAPLVSTVQSRSARI
jgi:nitrate/nitrite transporter NarK